jgi:hypothetical protein
MNPIPRCKPWLSVVLCLAFVGLTATSAQAQDYRDRRGPENWRERERLAQQERWRERERWREQRHYNEYRRRPDVYYSAPPAVHQPPGYYRQPGASLNFGFPFAR